MKRRAVLVDVAIDQGGCFETSRPTTHQAPTYLVDEIVHYCVANMPGAVPVTSSHALNNATLPFGLALAGKGIRALIEDPHLRAGLNVHRGQITNRAVADSQNLPAETLRKFWRREVRRLTGESGRVRPRAEPMERGSFRDSVSSALVACGVGLSDGCAKALRSTAVIGVLKLSPLGGTGDSNHFL